MDPLNNVPQGWDTSVRDENGLRTVPWSSVLGCVVGRNGARGGISPGGYGIHMQFRAVKGMAHHPTEDYMLIADACTAPCRGGIYKVYTKDTPSNECGIENNGGKWQTCFDRYMNCPPPAADRSNTCYKYDVKRVTIDPNNVNPSDSYEGVVDGIAIAPSGKYAVLSSSGGQSGSWLRVLDLETYGLSDYIGGHGGNGGRDGRRDGTLAVRPFCVQQGYRPCSPSARNSPSTRKTASRVPSVTGPSTRSTRPGSASSSASWRSHRPSPSARASPSA